MNYTHVSVLLKEAVDALAPQRGGIFVDCTAGGGGHSEEILQRLPHGARLISLDQDERAVLHCRERFGKYGTASTVIKANFVAVGEVLDGLGIKEIDGALWDLGVSSVQLDEGDRGFSYMIDAPLDMRMDRSTGITAADVVNTYSEEALGRIFRDFGEERFYRRIAEAILLKRASETIQTTRQLANIVVEAIPAAARHKENQHPARRTFQALRIEVNGELSVIEPSLQEAVRRLRTGGRAAVITFHSLEDRIVKQVFGKMESPCECPPDFPVCTCGKRPVVKRITKKPIVPAQEEIAENPRARSAKLRVVEKL